MNKDVGRWFSKDRNSVNETVSIASGPLEFNR